MRLPESTYPVLDSAVVAHMATIGPDGAPHVSPVWVGRDGDRVISVHVGSFQKIRNLERDPRVAYSLDLGRRNARGLGEYLAIRGTVEISSDAEDVARVLARLTTKYLGPEDSLESVTSGFVCRTAVTEVLGVGPWRASRK